ncbi:dihydroorotase [Clostridium cylindrosporum]|uniref:Dihydroorotase n=1 Tax=Clostridium cylindrosporum DSM 605 TaxID=1121307 RepID=A0A0J8DGC8_CLOCY|nr:dihydroorotase [Clostridium cylindrosporum]KMT23289.1 dihydroorotase PyrC [Clostridium cylindrosporum DSM 605]
MELLIKNTRIVDSNNDFKGDLYIKNGIIETMGNNLEADCETIDGEGLVLLPSFTDLHCHFRFPGLTHKEDMLSGSLAAVRGGYTAVNLMGNTNPICSTNEVLKTVLDEAEKIGLLNVHQVVSITKNFDGETLDHLDEIKYPIRFISDDGKGIDKSRVMLNAMMKAKSMGLIIMSHVEHTEIVKEDTRLSENIMTGRDVALARHTGCHLHVCHVSTKEAMEEIIRAKDRGDMVTCEVAPHHIALTSDEVEYRVNPPIRGKEDVNFLIDAIKNGYVDAIATDHAPHTFEDKESGAPGLSGIETSFSVCYTSLVSEGHISLSKLTEIMAKNPAKMMGLNSGEIKLGMNADLVLVDLNKEVTIDSSEFKSKGKNTPFDGKKYKGEVAVTIKDGKVVYRREK